MSLKRELIHVSDLLNRASISRRTLGIYRKFGIVEPVMRERGRPLFAVEAVETIERITRLRNDLGVNIAGAQVILEMRRKIEDLQGSLKEVVEFVHENLGEELERCRNCEPKPPVPKPLYRPPQKG
ncbi:MAG: hypothetical protein C0609_11640 [Deltaproteobacteria bacterium]|nr:MAG: hypothetical protein C0609_11640 [Deltaproteobacteria bacterium]